MAKKLVILVAVLLGVGGTAWAQEQGAFRVRVGYFEPDGGSEYWDEAGRYFTGGADDMGDVLGALEYLRRLSPTSSLLFTVSFWDGDTAQAYRDWTDDAGFSITHTTTLEMDQLTVAWVFDLARRPGPVVPYVGVGGGLYFWELREEGEFIDFGADPPEIVPARYQDSGTAPGLFVVGGLEFMVSPSWSLITEGRYHWVQDEVGSNFTGTHSMDLDLSGFEVSAGVSWRF